jgi:hypothetical protein
VSKGPWRRKVLAEEKIGANRSAFAKFYPETKTWDLSIPDRAEHGFYLRHWKDVPERDVDGLVVAFENGFYLRYWTELPDSDGVALLKAIKKVINERGR